MRPTRTDSGPYDAHSALCGPVLRYGVTSLSVPIRSGPMR